LPTTREDFTASGGQAQFARGAVHQPRAEPVFQLRQLARDHRPRQVEVVGRR
jgi:hypothetical protein